MGIGSELHGDDAAGILVARALPGHENLLVIEAGTAPENHIGKLRRFQPDVVLLVDAAHMNRTPGEIRALHPEAADGFSASTHSLPLALVAQYIAQELGCAALLIGIEPGDTTFGAPVAPVVARGVRQVCRALQEDR